jgi:hypothetical protein
MVSENLKARQSSSGLSNRDVLRLAMQGNLQAQFEVGYLMVLMEDSRITGLEWLSKAAAGGHPQAADVLSAFTCNEFK